MSARECESVADLQAQVAALEERVAWLEQRAGKHDCLLDLCDLDSSGDCRLTPRGEVWGSEPTGDEYDDAELIQS